MIGSNILAGYLAIGLFLVAIEVDEEYRRRMRKRGRVEPVGFVLSGLMTAVIWPFALYRTIKNGGNNG